MEQDKQAPSRAHKAKDYLRRNVAPWVPFGVCIALAAKGAIELSMHDATAMHKLSGDMFLKVAGAPVAEMIVGAIASSAGIPAAATVERLLRIPPEQRKWSFT
ncbi:MAG TPA: hypothetical protein VMV00_01600 [Candidatus Baltobacteraceae bacterium]|nr:hypothetical protein [Candidatus Baltobacteraceae bacterium]